MSTAPAVLWCHTGPCCPPAMEVLGATEVLEAAAPVLGQKLLLCPWDLGHPSWGAFLKEFTPLHLFCTCISLISCLSPTLLLQVSPSVPQGFSPCSTRGLCSALQATSLGSESEPPFLSSAEGNFIFSAESFSFQFYLVCLVLSLSPWDVADFSSWVPGRQGPWAQQARTGSGVGLGREDRSRAWVSLSRRLLCPSA